MNARWSARLAICLGLALPAADAAAQVAPRAVPVTPRALSGPWLGITFKGEHAPRVDEVFPGTGAARAGLAAGDLLLAIDGIPLQSGAHLIDLVLRHDVGGRIEVDLHRDGRALRLVVVASAKPPSGELLELRLVGSPLPAMDVVDVRDGGPIALGGPAVLAVISARCDRCGYAASRLAAAMAAERGLAMRTIIAGNVDEVGEYLRRGLVVGAVARWERPDRPGTVLAGLVDRDEGALLVVDDQGVVQFAAATSELDDVLGGILAAAARHAPRGRITASSPVLPPGAPPRGRSAEPGRRR